MAGGRALGALVRRHRLAAPLTQQELADAAGVHLKSVQAIEAGTSRPRPSTIRKLAAALGVPARELADAEKVHARLEAHRDELAQREAAWRAGMARAQELVAWCRDVAGNVDELTHEQRRLALTWLRARVEVWRAGHDPRWTLTLELRLGDARERIEFGSFVKVATDGELTGVGEGGGWPEIVQKGIEEVSHFLIGQNPFEIEWLWLRVYDVLRPA